MSRRLSAILLALCAILPTGAASEPFGLHAGDRPPSFSILRDNGDGTVVVGNLPARYPGLVQFFARYDDANGLCSIAGVTAPFDADESGVAARLYFQDLAARLSDRYGGATLYAFSLQPGSSGGDSWVGEIAAGRRFHYAFWHGADEGEARSVALSIGAGRDGRPFVLLTYDFANFERCADTRSVAAAPAL